jgi:hypothetical protein
MTQPSEPTKNNGLPWLRSVVGLFLIYWFLGSCNYTSSWVPRFFRKSPAPEQVPFEVRVLQEKANRSEYEGRRDDAARLRNEAATKLSEQKAYEDWKRKQGK